VIIEETADAGPVAALVSNSFLFLRYADHHPAAWHGFLRAAR
jgi:hypothetical protein